MEKEVTPETGSILGFIETGNVGDEGRETEAQGIGGRQCVSDHQLTQLRPDYGPKLTAEVVLSS